MKNFVAMAAVVALGFTSLPAAAQTLEAQAGALAGATSASQSASLSASQGGSGDLQRPSSGQHALVWIDYREDSASFGRSCTWWRTPLCAGPDYWAD